MSKRWVLTCTSDTRTCICSAYLTHKSVYQHPLCKGASIQHLSWQLAPIWRRSCQPSEQLCDYGQNKGMLLYAWNKATVKKKKKETFWLTPSNQGQGCQFFQVPMEFCWRTFFHRVTVTGQCHATFFWQLQDNIIAKCPRKSTEGVLLHQRKCPLTQVSCCHGNNSWLRLWTDWSSTTFSRSGSTGFSSVPKNKKNLAGTHFTSDDTIMDVAEAYLKMQDKAFFQEGTRPLQQF